MGFHRSRVSSPTLYPSRPTCNLSSSLTLHNPISLHWTNSANSHHIQNLESNFYCYKKLSLNSTSENSIIQFLTIANELNDTGYHPLINSYISQWTEFLKICKFGLQYICMLQQIHLGSSSEKFKYWKRLQVDDGQKSCLLQLRKGLEFVA